MYAEAAQRLLHIGSACLGTKFVHLLPLMLQDTSTVLSSLIRTTAHIIRTKTCSKRHCAGIPFNSLSVSEMWFHIRSSCSHPGLHYSHSTHSCAFAPAQISHKVACILPSSGSMGLLRYSLPNSQLELLLVLRWVNGRCWYMIVPLAVSHFATSLAIMRQ